MSVHITWIFHASTEENERSVASGQSRVSLSPKGIQQAKALHNILKPMQFDAAYSSDLPRCMETARIALADHNVAIVAEPRMREVDYGDYTGKPRSEVRSERKKHIHVPFPDGESYDGVLTRYQSLLVDLSERHGGQKIVLCGHGVYPMEVLVNHMPLELALFDYVVGDYRTFEF